MGTIDSKKIPPTPEQARALEEAKQSGSLSHEAEYRASIAELQAKLPGPLPKPVVIEPPTLEQRVRDLENFLRDELGYRPRTSLKQE